MKKMMMFLIAVTLFFSAAALAEEKDPLQFTTFGDAVNAALATVEAGDASYGFSSEGYGVALIRQDRRLFRAVMFFDEHANELYSAYFDSFSPDGENHVKDEYNTLEAYLMTLPVQYTEELTLVPFSQEDLDAMAGKTIGEVMEEPWELHMCNYPEVAEADKDIAFPMVRGFCEYELVINEPCEVYQERRAMDHYDPVTAMSLKNYLDLTVRSVKYTRVSFNVLDLHYQADGTVKGDADPFPDGYDYDLMTKIADHLSAVWEGGEPDQEAREAMIAELTAEHPEAAEMIRQIVESFH